MVLFVACVAFGVVAGISAGLLGIGGGTIMVPFLVLVAGLSQHSANATSLLVILPTSLIATWALRQKGLADLRRSMALGGAGVIGGIGGALLALALSGPTLRIVFAAFLAVVGMRMVRDGLKSGTTGTAPAAMRPGTEIGGESNA